MSSSSEWCGLVLFGLDNRCIYIFDCCAVALVTDTLLCSRLCESAVFLLCFASILSAFLLSQFRSLVLKDIHMTDAGDHCNINAGEAIIRHRSYRS